MEIKNFGYALKNIRIPTKSNYLKCLTDKIKNYQKIKMESLPFL